MKPIELIPRRKENARGPTPRDVSNLMIIGFFSTIVTWVVCDLCGAGWVPKEVAAAFGGISGYFVARKFRY